MKLFLTRLTAFLLLQVLIFVPFWNSEMPHEHNYLAAIINKHKRLESTPSPRIILIGGSNLAFGIKSDEIERELGIPLVNMGLNAHLGIPFMLHEVRPQIRPGDIVVLSLEHNALSEPAPKLVSAQALELRPAAFRTLSPSLCKEMIDRYGMSILGGLARRTILDRFHDAPLPLPEEVYRRDFFDNQGSFTGHYGRSPSRNLHFDETTSGKMPGEVRNEIAQFAQHCLERNALCLFSCPPFPAPLATRLSPHVASNLAELAKIPALTVLDSPADHAYATNLFFDSAYHLTEEGAGLRTKKLVAELKPFIKPHQVASK